MNNFTANNSTAPQLPPIPPELSPFGEFPPVVSDPIPEEDPAVVRRRRFWNKFGVEGFAVAVGLLVIFLLVAMLLVFRTFIYTKSPDDFTTGAGGGNSGEKVTMNTHRVKPKNARSMVKSLPKLVAKGASSVSLPDIPNVSLNALESGNPLGAASKGLGGGAGGGEGGGIGPGKGGGRNLVSNFFGGGFNTAGLVGTFYDLKQDARGTFKDPGVGGYKAAVREFCNKAKWSEKFLESRYFRAPQKLSLPEVYIPLIDANAAPHAYKVADKVRPSRWLALYKGSVKAPLTGQIRFVGGADDLIVVRWNSAVALDAGYDFPVSGNGVLKGKSGKPLPGTTDTFHYGSRPAMRAGPWISVTQGTQYPMEVLIGETPGGQFCAVLLFQKKGDKNLYLFRMTRAPLADRTKMGMPIKENIPAGADLTGGGYVWTPSMRRKGR
ncbi:MAG: hypothetical protein LBS59_08480 [Puniceicoccales bacterium]|jgi:hypothetical protein|nr:hypothetical protein [Puniceicoccales bacterium]